MLTFVAFADLDLLFSFLEKIYLELLRTYIHTYCVFVHAFYGPMFCILNCNGVNLDFLKNQLSKELWQNKDNKPKGFYAYGGAAAFLSEKKPNKNLTGCWPVTFQMNPTAQRLPSASTYLPSLSP